MIGLIIVTHGQLGHEMIVTLKHITGQNEDIRSISINADDDPIECLEQIKLHVLSADVGAGVIIATDLYGGTPSNLAISLIQPNKTEVIAGVNLPSLLKILEIRKDMPIHEVVKKATESGKKYMVVPSEFL
jgi:PTS system mannose-specific IIA component